MTGSRKKVFEGTIKKDLVGKKGFKILFHRHKFIAVFCNVLVCSHANACCFILCFKKDLDVEVVVNEK